MLLHFVTYVNAGFLCCHRLVFRSAAAVRRLRINRLVCFAHVSSAVPRFHHFQAVCFSSNALYHSPACDRTSSGRQWTDIRRQAAETSRCQSQSNSTRRCRSMSNIRRLNPISTQISADETRQFVVNKNINMARNSTPPNMNVVSVAF